MPQRSPRPLGMGSRLRRAVLIAGLAIAISACGPFGYMVDCAKYEGAQRDACDACWSTIPADLPPEEFLERLDRCVKRETGTSTTRPKSTTRRPKTTRG